MVSGQGVPGDSDHQTCTSGLGRLLLKEAMPVVHHKHTSKEHSEALSPRTLGTRSRARLASSTSMGDVLGSRTETGGSW